MQPFTPDVLVKAIILDVLAQKENDRYDFIDEFGSEIVKLLDIFLPLDQSYEAKLVRCLKAVQLADYLKEGSLTELRQTLLAKGLHEQPFDLINLLMDYDDHLSYETRGYKAKETRLSTESFLTLSKFRRPVRNDQTIKDFDSHSGSESLLEEEALHKVKSSNLVSATIDQQKTSCSLEAEKNEDELLW